MSNNQKMDSNGLEPGALARSQETLPSAPETEKADEKMRASKDKVRSKNKPGQKVRVPAKAASRTEKADAKMKGSKDKARSKNKPGQKVGVPVEGAKGTTTTTIASRAAAAAAPNLRGLGKNSPKTIDGLVKTGVAVAVEETTKVGASDQKDNGLESGANNSVAPGTNSDETEEFVGAFRVNQEKANTAEEDQEEERRDHTAGANSPAVPQPPSVEPEAAEGDNEKPALDSYLVEATLVTSFRNSNEDMENSAPQEMDVAPLVIAEKSQAVNFRSKRVLAGLFLVLLLIVGLVVGLVMSQSGPGSSAPAVPMQETSSSPRPEPLSTRPPTTIRVTEQPTLPPTQQMPQLTNMSAAFSFGMAFSDLVTLTEPTDTEVSWLLDQMTEFYNQTLSEEFPNYVSTTTELNSHSFDPDMEFPLGMDFQMNAIFLGEPPRPLFVAAAMSASGSELKNAIVAATNWGDLFNGMETSIVTLLQESSKGPTAVPLTLPPTQTPNDYTVQLDPFALDFALFEGSEERIPEDQEIIALLLETNRFYETVLEESNLTNAVSFHLSLQRKQFYREYTFSSVFFRVVCSASVYFEPESQIPSLESIWNTLFNANYYTYITEYVWRAAFLSSGIFYEVQMTRMVLLEELAKELTTVILTLPPTQAPGEHSITIESFTLDFAFLWWYHEPDEVSEQEYLDLLIKTKDFYRDTLGASFTGLQSWDMVMLESQYHLEEGQYTNQTFSATFSAVAHFDFDSEIPSSEEVLFAMWSLDYDALRGAIAYESAFQFPESILFNEGIAPVTGTPLASTALSPLVPQHNNSLFLESLAMEFGIGFNPRTEPSPSDEQVKGILNQLMLHFNQTLGALFPGLEAVALVPMDSLVVKEVVAVTPVFTWRLVFDAIIYFQLEMELPALDDVLLGVSSADSASLLALVRQSEPKDSSIFKDTQTLQFIEDMETRTRTLEGSVLKLGFYNGTKLRPPPDEDVEGLYDQTLQFYEQTSEEAFPNFEAMTFGSRAHQFDETSEFPALLHFSMNLYFQSGSEPPTKEEIASAFAIDTADYKAYITEFVWESAPKSTNFFVGTASMVSLTLENLPVVFQVSGSCRTCPVSNSTNNTGVFQLFDDLF